MSGAGARLPRARGRQALEALIAAEGVDRRVLEALRSIDRADFVPPDQRHHAYLDGPVVLPRGQTTSQPSLIARMVEAAEPGDDDTVLEVGTGYGFQTALLARLAAHVVSIERFPELAEAAEANLRRAGIGNVTLVVGDGWEGHAERAPYDAIVVSAAAPEVPEALAAQLAEGGRLVIPITRRGSDDVILFRKRRGEVTEERLLTPARFVPLVRGAARTEGRRR